MTLEEWLDLFRPAWMGRAVCTADQLTVFFASPGRGRSVVAEVAEAKRVCAGCPVVAQCLDYALVNNIEHGVWGGASERDRRKLRRARRLAA